MSRQRSCLSGQCYGSNTMHSTCKITDCNENNVVNSWSIWGDWSECTRTCGGGNRQRTRTCTSGIQSDCCKHSSLESCMLEYIQSRECINVDCVGTWSEWKPWGDCSVDCGEGEQNRTRTCETEDIVCVGGDYQARSCYVQCPISLQLKTDLESRKTCGTDIDNPCQNGGKCIQDDDGISCMCQGDWRGQTCDSLCLNLSEKQSCDNKRGMFYNCHDCNSFIICSRSGRMVPINCIGERIWAGDGCRLPGENGVSCFQQSSSETLSSK
ncbi:Thrombospondin type 1 repeat-containing protein [Mactra antiquata]